MRFQIHLASSGDAGFSRLIDVKEHSLDFCYHRHYHCPQCGALWASWLMESPPLDGYTPLYGNNNHYPVRRSCPDHAFPCWTGDKPGSLFTSHRDIAVAPRSILERELLLLTQGVSNV